MRQTLLTLLFITASLIGNSQGDLKYSKVKLHLHEHNLKEVAALGLESDHGSHAHHKHLINIYTQTELRTLRDAGITYDVLIADVKQFYKDYGTTDQDYVRALTRGGNCDTDLADLYDYVTPDNYSYGSMGGYLTYDQALAEMDKMANLYPNLITPRTAIGSIVTQEDRNLYYMTISNTPANIDLNKPQILYNSLHHAREPNSLSQNIFYMWYLLENYGTDPEVSYLVDNVTMFFLPIVNPDGYVYNETIAPNGGGLWRKNRYVNIDGMTVGVDLNRNYGYFWAYDDSGSSDNEESATYRGPGAFSEPETRAVRQLFMENDFKIALNYHTYGNLMIHPWGYSDEPTDEDDVFKSLARVMTTENDYLIGTGTETVGYVVNGDSDDWMYGEQTEKEKAYSLTPEVGPSFWPAEAQIDGLNKSALRQNLNAAHLLLSFAWAREIATTTEITDLTGSLSFQLEKSGLLDGTISFSVISESSELTLSGNLFPNLAMTIGETMDFNVAYEIDPSFAGSKLDLVMIIDNGNYEHRIPFTKTFNANALEPNITILDSIDGVENFAFGGNWNLTTEDFVSAPFSVTDSPNGAYDNGMYSEIILLNTIDLMNADSAFYRFFTKFEIEPDYDYVQLLVSTDGLNYQPMCGKYTNAAVPNQLSDSSPLYDGTQGEWVEESICLNDFIGNENVYIKYAFFSDNFVNGDGYYFDDIVTDIYTGVSHTSNPMPLSSVQVTPNPTADFIKINVHDLSSVDGLSYEVFTVAGQHRLSGNITDGSDKIDVSSLISGAYYISLRKDGQLISTTQWIKL